MTTITHLPLLLFFTLTLSIHANIHLNTGDHHALLTILKHLGVSGDLRPPENPCSTTGISCERRTLNGFDTLRVTGIVFETRRLTGFLSPAIGQLSELKELSLNDNCLNDRIPPELGNCRKIEVINFGNNKFSGEVPAEISYLLRLRILDLSSNEFTGELGFLKHFRNLEKLALENNMFTGKVPVSLLAGVKPVAVSGCKMRQIRSEIQTVGQIRHRNLLALLAHVSRPTCHYLVYEFMKNGSLQDILLLKVLL
ncbi:putative transferase, protein kinase RLK-Pelle-LRR-XI-2 family [Helianthus debilis subsp. tardiflorus]